MLKFKKSLSQNFLIDHNIKDKIIEKIKVKDTDIILEIGAGEGSISEKISNMAKKSHFIEIDKTYIKKLKTITNKDKSQIHNDNIINFNIKDIVKKYKKIRILGNVPYKISTKILLLLITYFKNITDIHLIVQKELADKLILKSSNKKYCKLSIKMNFFFEIKKLFDIKPQSFYPQPKIMSSFIRLKTKKLKQNIDNIKLFDKILTTAFNNRRKKITKSIKNVEIKNVAEEKRPTNTSLEEFILIYKELNKKKEECI